MAGTTNAREVEVLRRITVQRIIPVAVLDTATQAVEVANALMRGGISCIEVTFRTQNPVEAIERLCRIDGLTVGAGTLWSEHQVSAAVEAGAHFGLAPGLNESVLEYARSRTFPFFPGVATATEVERARSLGAHVAKVFPAAFAGGLGLLKALADVFPDMRFIPTGGIDCASTRHYLRAPGVIAVGCSWPVSSDLIRSGRFDEIERLAARARCLAI